MFFSNSPNRRKKSLPQLHISPKNTIEDILEALFGHGDNKRRTDPDRSWGAVEFDRIVQILVRDGYIPKKGFKKLKEI